MGTETGWGKMESFLSLALKKKTRYNGDWNRVFANPIEALVGWKRRPDIMGTETSEAD